MVAVVPPPPHAGGGSVVPPAPSDPPPLPSFRSAPPCNVWRRKEIISPAEAGKSPSPSPRRKVSSPLPERTTRTFAEVLAGSISASNAKKGFNAFCNPLPASFDNVIEGNPQGCEPVGIKEFILKDGVPCIYLSNNELDLLSKPLDQTLIGKFPSGRPKWVAVQRHFRELRMLGEYKLQHLDSKHIIIHFSNPSDYIRVFSRTISTINGYTIKFLKWSKEFDVNIEPSVTPI